MCAIHFPFCSLCLRCLCLLQWTTLNGCVTRWRGKVAQDNSFIFEEYECIKGDDVETPVNYEAKAARAAITGKPLLANLPAGENVTVTIDLISVTSGAAAPAPAPASVPASAPPAVPKIVAGAHFVGTCYSPLPFSIAVTDAKGADVKGTVEWPTLKAVTSFQGKLVRPAISRRISLYMCMSQREPGVRLHCMSHAQVHVVGFASNVA